ncbi:MAG: aminopeptidase, partial [Flavobacteriaceae bacterium]
QTYFDFNLNRPTDYLFQYSFFGRSETDGFFGQQFVMAEGGFKSLIPQSNANDWLISSNFNMGLWRWIEAYLDVGLLKNKNESVRTYYGSGIRINVLPDYLEVFFPMVSSLGWEATQQAYPQKIRFVLSIRTKQLANLFSRRWF